MNNCDRYGGQAAMVNQLGNYQIKDPSVDSAADAVAALKKRAEALRGNLAKVEGWKTELATVERMLVAAESKP